MKSKQKYRVDDVSACENRLRERGIALAPAVQQVDSYFNHPLRDFAQTDEALRIRRVGDSNYVTYKGKKIDTTTKTRRELEIPFASGSTSAEQFRELLGTLGFRHVADVIKQRRYGKLEFAGQTVEVALDDVQSVGQFVELEITADLERLDAARECLQSLANELGLTDPERRGYLDMLLER